MLIGQIRFDATVQTYFLNTLILLVVVFSSIKLEATALEEEGRSMTPKAAYPRATSQIEGRKITEVD